MKSLLFKIMVSLVVSVLIALAIVLLMTRTNLHRGMIDLIEQQEASQLENLVPELTELYQQNGSWEFLAGYPWRWNRLLQMTRPLGNEESKAADAGGAISGARRNPGLPGGRRQNGPGRPPEGRRLHQRDHANLKGRLFLLDEHKSRVAGAVILSEEPLTMEAIEVDGKLVGWVGFIPARMALPPEAERFLRGQARTLMISLIIALVLAAGLGFFLARHLSRPVRQAAAALEALGSGDYSVRAPISTQDEIGALGRNVNQLAATLEKNQTARRRWMADIAHELRTPVAVLKGEIEALRDGVRQVDEKTTASLLEEAEHLSRLVTDLQTLALSDAGALDFNRKPLDLSMLVSQTGDSWKDRLKERNITLENQITAGIWINGDSQRLRQLLHNLLENCYRYTRSGGRVVLTLASQKEQAVLTLDDSGPGLGKEQLPHVFERFYRAEGSRARSSGGSGLGLSICRAIVEAHHGSIEADSNSLGGLRIRAILPGD
jgi:two-component system sensor histidine kinase BaeS